MLNLRNREVMRLAQGHMTGARTRPQVFCFKVCPSASHLCMCEAVFDFRKQKSPPPLFSKKRFPGWIQWSLREPSVGRVLRFEKMNVSVVIISVSVFLSF